MRMGRGKPGSIRIELVLGVGHRELLAQMRVLG